MINNPKVSIHLSSYNHDRFIRQSIESALNQSFEDFELVIKDDASIDSSWEIIQSYSDPRIKAYRNRVNREKGFNVYFPEFMGTYIAIHHSDDVWETDKLEKQVAFLDSHQDIGAVFSLVQIIDENGQPRKDDTHHYTRTFDLENRNRFEWLRYFFINGNGLCHPSILIRKECYENCGLYNGAMVQLPDFDMWVRLCLKYEIHVLQEKLARFRVLDNWSNTSSPKLENQIRFQFEYLQVYRHYLRIADPNEFMKVFPEAVEFQNLGWFDPAYALAMIALKNKDFLPSQLFGLQLLFDLMNDPQKRIELKQYANFDTLAFKEISGRTDIFCYETRALMDSTRDQLAKCQQQVEYYSQSRSWKITAPLRKAISIFNGTKKGK